MSNPALVPLAAPRRVASLALFSLLAALLAVAPPSPARADDGDKAFPAFQTDRPDVSESAFTVPNGRGQWEVGLTRLRGLGGQRFGVDSLFRIGVADNWELRLGGQAPFRSSLGGGPGTTGFSDFVLGAKRHISDARGGRPAMGWFFNLKLPTGSAGSSNGFVEGNVLFAANKDLCDQLELEVNIGPGIARDRNFIAQGVFAGTLSYFTPKESKRVRIFAEAFGAAPALNGGRAATSAGMGIQYWVKPRLAVDFGFQLGLTTAVQQTARSNFYAGVGYQW
jgi:hypothetical protein